MVEMIQTGFMRQRRQLVIISAALFLYEIAEIRFTEFNIFGNKIEVDNPETISICIWVLFFYWLVRYYQYFRDLPNKRIIKSIENQVITRCNKIGKNSLKSKETRKKYFSKVAWDLYAENPNYITKMTQKVSCSKDNKGYYIIINAKSWKGMDPIDGAPHAEMIDHFYYFTKREIFPIQMRSFFHVLAHSRIYLEYFLPFFIALLPIIYKLLHLSNRFMEQGPLNNIQ